MAVKYHKQCKHCGKIIPAKNIRKEFCDDRCRKAYHRKINTQEAEEQASAEAEKNRPLSAEEQELMTIGEQIQAKRNELAGLEQTISSIKAEITEEQTKMNGIAKARNKTAYILIGLENRPKIISGKEFKQRYYNTYEWKRMDMLETLQPRVTNISQITDNAKIELPNIVEINRCKELLEKCNEQLSIFSEYFTGMGMPEYTVSEERLQRRGLIGFPIAEGDRKKSIFMPPNKIKQMEERVTKLNSEITQLEGREQQLKQSIESNKKSKNIEDIKDELGFVPAKEIKNINFGNRLQLGGDIGIFLGRMERKRCAITLSGQQGSGKTYLCFDIASAFIDKGYSVAYFSLEEGITDLVKEKIKHYQLDNVGHLHFAETGGLKQIQQAAEKLDVVMIDSWGKLNAPIEEFDKLRTDYPDTIFIVIFQLTTSGHLRGGTKAAYDSAANIEVFKKDGKRLAQFRKNRYGSTDLVYSVDERRLAGQ